MNKRIIILGMALLVAGGFGSYADETNQPGPSGSGSTDIPPVILPDKGKRRSRPISPIRCEHGTGFISLALPAGVQSASFTLSYGDEPLYYGVYFASDRYVTIPDLSGEIAIEITADNGSVYAGILTF